MRWLTLALLAILVACRRPTPDITREADAAPKGALIIDVRENGDLKLEGDAGSSVEVRANPTTPYGRAMAAIDKGKQMGGMSFVLVTGDRRTQPFGLQFIDRTPTIEETVLISVTRDGTIFLLNGETPIASVKELGPKMADASAALVRIVADIRVELEKVVDVIFEVQRIGRSIALGISAPPRH
jgi:biopolymer transport protein ExbD